MTPELLKALLPLAVQLYKAYMEYYNGLTPEQREELHKATKECFDQAGNFNLGSGE
mgnify:CR=1 FL=1